MEGIGILSENLVDASQDLPRRTGEVAACRWVGNEQGRLAVGRCRKRRAGRPADQRDRSRAEETLELDPAFVSALTGVVRSTLTVARTSSGRSALNCRRVTSPTRIPLNRTAEPSRKPETEPSKRTR